ncbi:hypothetical protein HNP84_009287 [Thermocatellispora tengchongensis]|uniref:DUF2157 domain-containing protein n=1 Tax=Thermocatellispora tengchongensis TaxID=1073253 RepID=A0A840PDN6_9ACTN|nr:zinc ribbon domain-containing protein [Thermocatellispora tengchongensis]MBB5139524.1 hypothetical protein [Thermocatellispora tengchongensis]
MMRASGRPACPGCGAELPDGATGEPACPACGLALRGPAAHELWQVDQALAGLEAERERLRARRAYLLSVLRHQPPPPGAPVPPPVPVGAVPPGVPPRPEVSARGAQNVLLAIGGVLLTVAAIVFTAVSWGRLGIGGRAAVLAGFTALALAVPVALLRRGLRATAETVAGLAAVLLLLDAYALWRLDAGGVRAVETADYVALTCAVVGAILGAYGGAAALRVPVAIAVGLGQFVLPLAFGDTLDAMIAMLTATVALDLVLARYVRVPATACGAAVFGVALALGVAGALIAQTWQEALPRSALLTALAALGVLAAARRDATGVFRLWQAACGVVVAVALITALVAPSRPMGDWRGDWQLALVALAALLVGAAMAAWTPWRPTRAGGMWTAGAVLGLVALVPLAGVLESLARPFELWAGTLGAGAWPDRLPDPLWHGATAAGPVVYGLAALALALLSRSLQDASAASASRIAAVAVAAVAVACVPDAYGLPYPAGLGVLVALVAGLVVAARWVRPPAGAAAVAAVAAALAGAYAFGHVAATLAVLPALALLAGLVAWRSRGRLRDGALGAGVLLLGQEGMAVGLALGWSPPVAASVGCSVAGVLLGGLAVRSRRPRAGYLAAAFLVLAAWLRIGAAEVTVVEAYTLPCSVALLGFGWAARRRVESSWTAYGAGLSVTLLPSLAAVYLGEGWLRPLLLGTVALGLLLLGGVRRVQAPVVLGGGTLLGVAAHELAPWVAEVVLAVPRWVPIALGGLLLVLAGATYEARKRDVRRLRDLLARMR